jgi:hypothetical protein
MSPERSVTYVSGRTFFEHHRTGERCESAKQMKIQFDATVKRIAHLLFTYLQAI